MNKKSGGSNMKSDLSDLFIFMCWEQTESSVLCVLTFILSKLLLLKAFKLLLAYISLYFS